MKNLRGVFWVGVAMTMISCGGRGGVRAVDAGVDAGHGNAGAAGAPSGTAGASGSNGQAGGNTGAAGDLTGAAGVGAAGASAAGAGGGAAGATAQPPIADAGQPFIDGSPPEVEPPPPLVFPADGQSYVNATNWNETDIHPFAKRRMLVRDEGSVKVCLLDFADPSHDWCHAASSDFSNGFQLVGNNLVLGSRPEGYDLFDLATGQIVKTVTGFSDTQSAYRMANGETMLTRSGTVLTFLDKNDDRPTRQIAYPGYGFVRMARPTRNGTFLVPADLNVFEGDATGRVLWMATAPEWGHVFEAFLMKDGSTIVGTAYGASLDILDPTTHMVTKRIGTKAVMDFATIKPDFFAEFQILPNGNLITSNWQGHGLGNGRYGVQVLEFNPAGELVWEYKQDPTIFSSIQGLMVLDGLDPRYLHVLETSDDSTWQPVNPTSK